MDSKPILKDFSVETSGGNNEYDFLILPKEMCHSIVKICTTQGTSIFKITHAWCFQIHQV